MSFLTLNMAMLVFKVEPVRAAGIIYIHEDGSIEPTGAPITTTDNATYVLTNSTSDSIYIERSNMVFHGNSFTIQGSGSGPGIDLNNVVNATVEDVRIIGFQWGIYLRNSNTSNSILNNYLAGNAFGIFVSLSYNNLISGNNVTNCTSTGIYFSYSTNNTIYKNLLETNYIGAQIQSSSNNKFFHNNFILNTYLQAYISTNSSNSWDGGYPWCGNYWSNYNGTDINSGPFKNETDPDGAGDTPYALDTLNIDNYPLMNPWTPDFTVLKDMVLAYPYSPRSLDPACVYDTASAEILLNVYETLVFFDEEKTDQFVPRLATDWQISPDGLTYTFTIRQGVKFHNNENLSAEDVEYSFERMLVIEWSHTIYGPAWMFYEAFFDRFESHYDNGTFAITGQQIDGAVTRNESTIAFHLAKQYPPFLQLLSQTWGSILSKKWCTQIGDWPGTWNNWTTYNRPTGTAIENQTTGPPGPRTDAMCGTGPFMLDYYVTNGEWQLLRFENYWRGWPATGSGSYLRRVKVLRVDDTQTRMGMFLEGLLDHTQVPRAAIDEVLGQPGVRSIYPLEQLSCEAFFFTFNISTSSPLMGVPGGLPNGTINESGIPPDFFTDINVRKGFAHALNYSQLIAEALRGEAYQPATPIIPGLPFYNSAQERYSIDLAKANQSFSQAWGGQLSSLGFNFTLCYYQGNSIRQKACEILKANVESLNPKFHVQLRQETWSFYVSATRNHENPIFFYAWLADYADPHNFAYAFMYSGGDFVRMQLYSNSTIDTLVMQGISTMNETARREIYYELQRLYHEDCPSVPTYQPIVHRFERTWVQGWYYNPLLYGNYFYTQWKGSFFNSTRYSWPMFRHDPTHAGYSEGPAPETNQTRWNCTTGNAVYSSPAVADGRVYIGSYDGGLYCLDAYNGTQIWNSTIGYTDSSPAIAYGRVYIGSYDNEVYCLDALTGAQIWNHTTIDEVTSSPTVVDGRVYVGSFGGEVYCLDAMTGVGIWNRTTGSGVDSSPAVVGGKVYVGSYDGIVHCLDAATGEPVWNSIVGLSIFSSPAVADNRLYVGADNGTFYCLDAVFGTVIWKNYVGGCVYSSPAIANGRVYIGSENGQIICFYALTGEWAWNQTIGATDSSPAVADGKVYIGSSDGKVYCYNATTGLRIWTYTTDTTGDAISSSPAIADGMVFVGVEDGNVYAFGNVIRVPQDYPTIQGAINAATSGATIWIEPGIYHETLIINKTVTLIGKLGSEPIFNGGGSGIAITIVPSGSGSIVAGIVITRWDQGLLIINATDCKIYDNIMSLMNQNGMALQGSNASSNLVYCNIFEQNAIAVNLSSSATNNTIYNNIISLSGVGINVESSGNIIYANIITQNQNGINLKNSNNNRLFHNNFIDNIIQLSISASSGNVWDDGYPSGGNYWACHISIDSYSGQSQNIQGADGIVDVPYTVATDNVDNYPLLRPFSLHNIGITCVVKSKNIIGQSFTLRMNVTILNLGMYNETFTFKFTSTLDTNSTALFSQTISICRRNSSLLMLTWNTTGYTKGGYTLRVEANVIPDETDTGDNVFSCFLIVTIPGDVNGNGIVNILDAIVLGNSFLSTPSGANWNPDADINSDDVVNILDSIIAGMHFLEHYP